jgi:hypothetical protein
MTTQFPLYNNIYNDVIQRNLSNDLTINQKTDIINYIKKTSHRSHELIYTLIRIYQIYNDDLQNNMNYPYNCKKLKSGYKFDLERLPITLKHIINSFIQMDKNSSQ